MRAERLLLALALLARAAARCAGPAWPPAGAAELQAREAGAHGRYELRLEARAAAACAGGALRLAVYVHRLELGRERCGATPAAEVPRRLHSLQETDRYVAPDPDSPQINLIHHFDFLFEGCYRMTYEWCRKVNKTHNDCHLMIFYKWLQNNHTEEEFINLLSAPYHFSNEIRSSTLIRWLFGYPISKEYTVTLYENNAETNTDVTKLCSLNDKRLMMSCKLPNNIEPGTYFLQYNANEPRCKGEIFYNVSCTINTEFNVLKKITVDPPKMPPGRRDMMLIAIIGISSLLVLVIFLMVYYQSTKRSIIFDKVNWNWENPNYVNVASDTSEVKLKGIVLVYARDCEPFMAAMVQFRRLLEIYCKVKVYDIFDSELYNNEISRAPMEWAQKILAEPSIRVVIVRTPCGELLYETMMAESARGLQLRGAAVPTRVQYHGAPRYTDTLLLFLFRLIKDDAIRLGSYRKYFVVHIANFSGANQLPQVNPYERYELPAAIGLLASNIQDRSGSLLDEEFDVHEEKLRLAMHDLLLYVQDKPDYIYAELLHFLQ